MAFERKFPHHYLEAIFFTCKQFSYQPKEFPSISGIYLITVAVGLDRLFYIGEARDIHERFSNNRHHRRHELDLLHSVGVPISIRIIPTPWLSDKERYELEQHLKRELNPLRNDKPWLVPQKDILKKIRLPKSVADLNL